MNQHSLNGKTQLINRCNKADLYVSDELVSLLYQELISKAHYLMQGERSWHMLLTHAVIHQVYLRLIELGKVHRQRRNHFFAVAAGVMRRVLVDQARINNAYKRGGNAQLQTLHEEQTAQAFNQNNEDILSLDQALKKLSYRDKIQANIVELRYFAGINIKDTAEILGLSSLTVKRKWIKAKAQLYQKLHPVPA